MIFTETREGRRFVGEIPPGAPVLATLRSLCSNYRIASGWLDGVGLVRDAVLQGFDAEGMPLEPVRIANVSQLLSMRVAISEQAGALDLRAQVLLLDSAGRTAAGLLQDATSASVEFTVQTFDDITLRRFATPLGHQGRWLDVAVQASQLANEIEVVRSGSKALEAMPSRLLERTEMPELKPGDALAHPRLGFCVVTQVTDSERVAVQMESGQIAQLHLGMLRLTKAAPRQGRAVYDVTVRKRGS
jgi:predicted DNA-binding protein with PD1-like motif